MESQPQDTEFRINLETFTHGKGNYHTVEHNSFPAIHDK